MVCKTLNLTYLALNDELIDFAIHLDLHTKNIAFSLPDIDSWSIDEFYAAFGEPVKLRFSYVNEELYIRIAYNGHQPEYLIAPPSTAVLWDLCTRDRLPNIRILDSTESFLAHSLPTNLCQVHPRQLPRRSC